MKRMFIAIVAIITISTSSLFAGATGILSYGAYTFGGEKKNQWDYLYEQNNITYNELSGHWITNATHTGDGYSMTVVIGTNIDKNPIVGMGIEDGNLVHTAHYNGYSIFYHKYKKGSMSGQFNSFYSEGNGVLSSMDRFLRYP